jgi:Ca2+/Na+ antiporter
MIKENTFSPKLTDKSDSEVQYYIDNKDQFHEEAVLAAIWELERRGILSEESEKIEEDINEKIQSETVDIEDMLGIPVNTVSPGIRFVHFLIDEFIIQLFILLINFIPFVQVNQLLAFILYPVYYIFFEYYYQRTPGKLISSTIVTDKHGNKPGFKAVVLRSFARLVPFEPLSCLGTVSWGWHDRWTETYVIPKSSLPLFREKIGNDSQDITTRKFGIRGYVIIAVFVAIIAGGSIYTNYRADYLAKQNSELIKQLDSKDRSYILGVWNTHDAETEMLNFISAHVVISGKRNLNYEINGRILTITDNSEYAKSFVITDSSSAMFKLIDIDNPYQEIVWKKQQ